MTIYAQPDPTRRDTLDDLYDRLCANFCAALPKTLTIGPDEPPFYAQIFKAVRDEVPIVAMPKEDARMVGGYLNHLKASHFQRIENWTRRIENKAGQLLKDWSGAEPTAVNLQDVPSYPDSAGELVHLRNRQVRVSIVTKEPMKRYQISTTVTYTFGDYAVSPRAAVSTFYESRACPTNEYCEVLLRQEIVEEGIEIAKHHMHDAEFDYCLTSPVSVVEVPRSTKVDE